MSGSVHMSLTHHVPLQPSTENSWDGKVPPALEEHSQDVVSLLSSTGFWKFLTTNTIPAQAVGFWGEGRWGSRELQQAQMKKESRKKQPPERDEHL